MQEDSLAVDFDDLLCGESSSFAITSKTKKSLLNKKSINSIVKVNNVKVNNVKVLADEKISQPTEVFARVISYPTLHLALSQSSHL